MIVLVPINADGEDGAPIQFNQPYVHVGRGAHNDLILDEEDAAASYEHAVITVLQGHAVVQGDPTANPTFIDGADITSAPEDERQLHVGDIISFGKGRSIFRVRQVGEAHDAGEPAHQQVRVPPAKTVERHEAPADDSPSPGIYPITFQVCKGDQLVRVESFSQPLIRVGRMKSSHLHLDDESVSRTHAVIEVTAEGEVLLIDLDSSSGTAVNGHRVKKATLTSGDRLEFGGACAIVTYGKARPAAAVARAAARSASGKSVRGRAAPPPLPPRAHGPAPADPAAATEWGEAQACRLVIRRDGVVADELAVTKAQTSIGRLPQNDVRLDDASVSGKHALLVAEAGVFVILDQHSTNGTYVNGERCTGESLRDGDVIQIGRFEVVFRAARPSSGHGSPKTEVLSPEMAHAMLSKAARRGNKR